jgi:hypothetical protein
MTVGFKESYGYPLDRLDVVDGVLTDFHIHFCDDRVSAIRTNRASCVQQSSPLMRAAG